VRPAAVTNTTAVSDCQTPSGQIPGDQPEQVTDGYGGKDKADVNTVNCSFSYIVVQRIPL